MSRQFFQEGVAWATSSGTAVANSTTETILFPGFTVSGNYLQDGRVLRMLAFGGHGTTATPTLTLSVRLGGVSGTVIAKSGAFVTTSGVGGGASMTAMWRIEMIIQTRSNGSAGTLMSNGIFTAFTSTVPTAGTVTNYGCEAAICSGTTGGSTPATASLDLTVDQSLVLTATWGTANAANSIQGHNLLIESIN
jgi:hypothetical protein